jgi:outer membrane protein
MRKIIIFCFYLFPCLAFAQNRYSDPLTTETLSLEQVIDMAIQNSISSRKASTARETSYWEWRTFKSNYRPQLALNGTLPDFNRTINPVIQPDGNIIFRPINYNNSSLSLGLSQAIGTTGGEIFVSSQMHRFDDFQQKFTSYNSAPAVIGINQPLFMFNRLAWDRKIEPLRYEESQKRYTEEMEAISFLTTSYFFELLQAQVALKIAKNNLATNDTILKISNVKYELGKISRGELLQLELARKNDQKALAQAKLAYDNALLQLNIYTGSTLTAETNYAVPAIIPQFEVNEELALTEARRNRQKAVEFRRAILEANMGVARAKGDNGLNANLFASFGLTNTAQTLSDSYVNPLDQQIVRMGFTIPIMDWGRSASRIKTAQANQELVRYTVAQDELNFTQEIYTQIRQFNMLREQVKITYEADQIATERYSIFKNRYLIGELGLTDLNIAQMEKDQATRDYISTIREFWMAHANLRLLTLYDFELQQTIAYKSEN